ncbi:MAG: methyltransferase domain-containing protein [Desulfobacteria bacterium]
MGLRVLTFNWHESYIHQLAKTGYRFDVVQMMKGGLYGWIHAFRPVPGNCTLITEDEARKRLAAGYYDRIVAHNVRDLVFVSESDIPKALVFHTAAAIQTGTTDANENGMFIEKVRELTAIVPNVTSVFVSPMKKETWGLDGEVILLAIDLAEYGGYTGTVEKVLRVGNFLKEGDRCSGFSLQERVLSGIPSTVLGLNPTVTGAYVPKDWDDLRGCMRRYRAYLNTTLHPLNDGYNCAMLEAMGTGMPVVSVANPSSPIEDGVNGYVSADERELRGRIDELLRSPDLAHRLGERGRETIAERFPIGPFLSDWKRVLEGTSKRVSVLADIGPAPVAPNPGDAAGKEASKDPGYFQKERREIEAIIPAGASRILDVGCGEGMLGRILLRKGAAEVVGIEADPAVARKAQENLSRVLQGDVESLVLPFDDGYFDCIVLADVLEHLRDPLSTMIKLHRYLSDSGTIVASIPNVRFFEVIRRLAEGRWEYQEFGILDKTHLRFFTKKEIEVLFSQAGLELTGISENLSPLYYTLPSAHSGDVSFGRVTLHGLSREETKDLFVIQYLIVARKADSEARGRDRRVSAALESGDLDSARSMLEESLEEHPLDADALLRHSEICSRLGRSDEAIADLDKILLFHPGRKDALERKAALVPARLAQG